MSIIIPRHLLYLLYLCPCLDLGLFMSYLCNPIFICIFIFTDILLLLFIFQNIYHYYFWMITWMENIVFKQQMFSLRVQHLLDFFFQCIYQIKIMLNTIEQFLSNNCQHQRYRISREVGKSFHRTSSSIRYSFVIPKCLNCPEKQYFTCCIKVFSLLWAV